MIGTFTKGQRVRVYPHGSPHQADIGDVMLISGNQRSIMVRFDHMPPFAFTQSMPEVGFHFEGILLLAGREELNGKPWGPWIEIKNEGHFEIEELENGAQL